MAICWMGDHIQSSTVRCWMGGSLNHSMCLICRNDFKDSLAILQTTNKHLQNAESDFDKGF